MKVLVAGASGAMGLPVTRELLRRGHEVIGLTRRPENAAVIESVGASAALGDVLDVAATKRAVDAARPEAIVNLLTALPKRGPVRFGDLEATNVVRDVGTRNLVEAARASGVRRLVAESIVFVYGYGDCGDDLKTESSPVTVSSLPAARAAIEAQLSLERQTLEAGDGIEGVVLRYGLFYGPEVGSTVFVSGLLKKRLMPFFGDAAGAMSWIHVEDGAAVTVLALEKAPPGSIYNVVDDDPVPFRDFVETMASSVGAKMPITLPKAIGKLGKTYVSQALDTNLRVSNARAKEELGWVLRYPTYREGLRSLRAPAEA